MTRAEHLHGELQVPASAAGAWPHEEGGNSAFSGISEHAYSDVHLLLWKRRQGGGQLHLSDILDMPERCCCG